MNLKLVLLQALIINGFQKRDEMKKSSKDCYINLILENGDPAPDNPKRSRTVPTLLCILFYDIGSCMNKALSKIIKK